MSQKSAFPDLGLLPKPGDPEAAATGAARWRDEAPRRAPDRAEAIAALAGTPDGAGLLDALFGNSPFLGSLALADPEFLLAIAERGCDSAWRAVADDIDPGTFSGTALPETMARLRRAKARAALTVAVADMAGAWPLEEVTRRLSEFACLSLDAGLTHLLSHAAAIGEIALPDTTDPIGRCGYAVLGMGKLGANELNYSSDIDLIVIFDDERIDYRGSRSVSEFAQRLTRDLIRIMEERTADGYVFRTDLRLRPDPGSTPPAMLLAAAEAYYESMGQNWERAAMIKARPVAGDRDLGASFLDLLRPFIWRKYLDFAAIQDIHSIKRQIARHRGGNEIKVAGHNVKLGRGGIREIEFFAQTQQLIWGGRDPALRSAGTLAAIDALAAAGHVTAGAADDLKSAYIFLRRIEHRLQMIDDQQTQTLPVDAGKLHRLAVFVGFSDGEVFALKLREALASVASHYDDLFGEAPSLAASGSLVFTGGDPHPDTIETLADMGFRDTETIWHTVRSWHHGRYRATRSDRARQILTEIKPALLGALARTANPDAAFLKFDEFLRGLPAGVQLLSLFLSNPDILDLVAEIMGTAPRLAERLARYPILLDAVIGSDFAESDLNEADLERSLNDALAPARDFQDVLDIVRRWTNDRHFLAGVRILRNDLDAASAGPFLSRIAGVVIRALLPRVEDEFGLSHGVVPGGRFAVLGLGKLGGRELSLGSDLDLVFVYDAPEIDTPSDGDKPLQANAYYARLAQRLINALTTLTAEGGMFEVDMRLRPAGNAGPIASSLEGFRRYYANDAWTWEKMALTKARVIAESGAISGPLTDLVRTVLAQRRDPEKLRADIADMRSRIASQHPGSSQWDVKYAPGGLIDVEFLTQYLELRHAHDHPDVLSPNTGQALKALRDAGCLESREADILIAAAALWLRVQGILRLCVGAATFEDEGAPEGLREALGRSGENGTIDALKDDMARAYDDVRLIFDRLIGR